MAVLPVPSDRPRITISSTNEILHNDEPCRIVLREHLISVGCTDITPEALAYIYRKYKDAFPPVKKEIILQP